MLDLDKIKKEFDEILANLDEKDLLIWIAEQGDCDKNASEAMKQLREKYDKTYFWCWDCDGCVTTSQCCCMNVNNKT